MSIFDLFAKSPFRPLQEHMRVVEECAEQVSPLIEAVCRGDDEALRRCHERIHELEGRADALKNDLRSHLPKRLMLPVDRRDLLEILHINDGIADTAQDIADLLVERHFDVPESMRAGLRALVEAAERTCSQGAAVVGELDELLEMGFRGREAERVEGMINQLGTLEAQCDRLESQLRSQLFRLEGELSAVSVMLWFQIIDWIGDLADMAEKSGNRIWLLIAA